MKVIVLQHISAAEFSHQFIYGTGNAYSDAVGSIVRDDAHRERLSTGQHRMVLPRKLSTYRVFRAVFLSEGHDNQQHHAHTASLFSKPSRLMIWVC